MTEATATFFNALGQLGHEPLLEQITGTIRFDLRQGKRTEHFLVSVQKGDVTVSNQNEEADSVVIADRELFDDFASGQKNVMSAFLRREVSVQGDPRLLVLFQRIFPGPLSSPAKSVARDAERSRT